jgi:hypothetical protein
MARFKHPLNHVQVASPCKADWGQMIGSDRVRFCAQCSLNVFNLSGMSRIEAERLIAQTEGRLCVRFYRRSDGSIITSDCPFGLRAIKRRVSYLIKAILAAALTFMASVGVHLLIPGFPLPREQVVGVMVPRPSTVRPPGVRMGEIMTPKKPESNKRKSK